MALKLCTLKSFVKLNDGSLLFLINALQRFSSGTKEIYFHQIMLIFSPIGSDQSKEGTKSYKNIALLTFNLDVSDVLSGTSAIYLEGSQSLRVIISCVVGSYCLLLSRNTINISYQLVLESGK